MPTCSLVMGLVGDVGGLKQAVVDGLLEVVDLEICAVHALGNGGGHFADGDRRVGLEAQAVRVQRQKQRVDNGFDLGSIGALDAVLRGGNHVLGGDGLGGGGVAKLLRRFLHALDLQGVDVGQRERFRQKIRRRRRA